MFMKRFKLIYLPEGSSKKREFTFRKGELLISLFALITAFLLLSGGTAYLLNDWLSAQRFNALQYKNAELKDQLSLTEKKAETLTNKIEFLTQSDNELRSYAQLPLLDAEVMQMGIGGSLPYRPSITTGAEELLSRLDQIDRQVSLQENSLLEIRSKLAEQEEYLKSVPSLRPVKGGAFSSFFGKRRDPFTGQWAPHRGLDISAPTGTPIYSTAGGKVVLVRREPAYGKVIVIDHGNGYSTLYAHMNRFYVSKGDIIKRSDPIGEVGNTGRSSGPHLHYEVRLNKKHLDPLDFMFDGYAVAKVR